MSSLLIDVEAGGKIVFPYLKVGVVPKAGSLLYWTTKTNAGMLIQYNKNASCQVIGLIFSLKLRYT